MLKTFIAPFIPYFAVGAGFLIFRNAWAAILSYHLGMAIIIWLCRTKTQFRRLFQSSNYKITLAAALIGASGGIVLFLLRPFILITGTIDIRNFGLTGKTWPLFIVYYVSVNPFIEEYYWRGLLGSVSKRIVPNDVFFAGYHAIVLAGYIGATWLALFLVVLSAAAWFWRQINNASEGLLPSTVSHIAADLTIILTIYSMTVR